MDKAENSKYKGTPKMQALYENVLNVLQEDFMMK